VSKQRCNRALGLPTHGESRGERVPDGLPVPMPHVDCNYNRAEDPGIEVSWIERGGTTVPCRPSQPGQSSRAPDPHRLIVAGTSIPHAFAPGIFRLPTHCEHRDMRGGISPTSGLLRMIAFTYKFPTIRCWRLIPVLHDRYKSILHHMYL
jgi:hypothetical protein